MNIYIYIYIYIYACVCVCVCVCVSYIFIYMYLYIFCNHIYIYIYIYILVLSMLFSFLALMFWLNHLFSLVCITFLKNIFCMCVCCFHSTKSLRFFIHKFINRCKRIFFLHLLPLFLLRLLLSIENPESLWCTKEKPDKQLAFSPGRCRRSTFRRSLSFTYQKYLHNG